MDVIFYQEPIIKDLLGSKTLDEIDKISEKTGIDTERIIKLKNIDENELLKIFNEKELHDISKALGVDFETLFIRED